LLGFVGQSWQAMIMGFMMIFEMGDFIEASELTKGWDEKWLGLFEQIGVS